MIKGLLKVATFAAVADFTARAICPVLRWLSPEHGVEAWLLCGAGIVVCIVAGLAPLLEWQRSEMRVEELEWAEGMRRGFER